MNLLDLFVKISCKDEASPKLGGVASNITGTMSKAAGVVSAVMGSAAVAGTVAIAKSALDAYASYEQLVGGVETLFRESSGVVQRYAAGAYKTAGVSANKYMEQATSFSASLVQSLGGDTRAAAEYANTAIVDMSDNANKMGTSIDEVQNAYQSLMRGNYAMLDNLKLGYGGTKAELERLVDDAERLTGRALDPSKFSDIVAAIHAVQENMGITGTTAREAAGTIEGSVSTMRAAWDNWLAGLGDEGADMTALTDQLVESVVVAGENIIPRVGTILDSIVSIVSERAPGVASALYEGLVSALPDGLEGAVRGVVDAVSKVVDGIADMLPAVRNAVPAVAGLVGAFVSLKAVMAISDLIGGVRAGLVLLPAAQTAVSNAQMILNAVMGMNPFFAVVTAIGALVAALVTLWSTNDGFRDAVTGAWSAILAAASSVWGAVVNLFTVTVPGAIRTMGDFFAQLPGRIGSALSSAISRVGEFVSGVSARAVEAGSRFLRGVSDGFNRTVDFVKSVPGRIVGALGNVGSLLFNAGQSILQGLLDGIKSMVGRVTGFVSDVVGKIRSFFPFSPAKRGPFSGRGYTTYSGKALITDFARSIRDNGGEAVRAMQTVMDDVRGASAYAVSAAPAGGPAASSDAAEEIRALRMELGRIIRDNAPVMGRSEFDNRVRRAVAYAR